MLRRTLALLLLLAAACAARVSPPPVASPDAADAVPVPHDAFDATVVRGVDGDTILARVGAGQGVPVRVRLVGVDSPESVKPNTPVACYGHEASAFTSSLLSAGLHVRAAYEVQHQDRYGRELWDLWLPDGRFVQSVLAASGTVRPDPFPPNTLYAGPIAAAARQAHDAARGLWGHCALLAAFPQLPRSGR